MVVVVVVIVDICRMHIHESDNIANKKYCPSLLLRVPQGTRTWPVGRPARWGVGGGVLRVGRRPGACGGRSKVSVTWWLGLGARRRPGARLRRRPESGEGH